MTTEDKLKEAMLGVMGRLNTPPAPRHSNTNTPQSNPLITCELPSPEQLSEFLKTETETIQKTHKLCFEEAGSYNSIPYLGAAPGSEPVIDSSSIFEIQNNRYTNAICTFSIYFNIPTMPVAYMNRFENEENSVSPNLDNCVRTTTRNIISYIYTMLHKFTQRYPDCRCILEDPGRLHDEILNRWMNHLQDRPSNSNDTGSLSYKIIGIFIYKKICSAKLPLVTLSEELRTIASRGTDAARTPFLIILAMKGIINPDILTYGSPRKSPTLMNTYSQSLTLNSHKFNKIFKVCTYTLNIRRNHLSYRAPASDLRQM